jgi:hypothetical protein
MCDRAMSVYEDEEVRASADDRWSKERSEKREVIL